MNCWGDFATLHRLTMPALFATRGVTGLIVLLCLFGLVKRLAKAEPLAWKERGSYREAKINTPLGQAPGFTLLSAFAYFLVKPHAKISRR